MGLLAIIMSKVDCYGWNMKWRIRGSEEELRVVTFAEQIYRSGKSMDKCPGGSKILIEATEMMLQLGIPFINK